jgi:hypothetical protein
MKLRRRSMPIGKQSIGSKSASGNAAYVQWLSSLQRRSAGLREHPGFTDVLPIKFNKFFFCLVKCNHCTNTFGKPNPCVSVSEEMKP